MRLTTKSLFAVTAMVDLAFHSCDGPVALAVISGRHNISLPYLFQLFSKLRRHRLVNSVRGSKGGYVLALPVQKVTIADILLAVDESIDATRCKGKKNCRVVSRGVFAPCVTHDFWDRLTKKVDEYLRSVSLGDLVYRRSFLKFPSE